MSPAEETASVADEDGGGRDETSQEAIHGAAYDEMIVGCKREV